MKALSIQQPWAWLIAKRHKDIENRTWRTHYRGKIAIHASKWQPGASRKIHGIDIPDAPVGAIIAIADL